MRLQGCRNLSGPGPGSSSQVSQPPDLRAGFLIAHGLPSVPPALGTFAATQPLLQGVNQESSEKTPWIQNMVGVLQMILLN